MAWQCDKCGKMNPNTSGNCIHCGASDGSIGQMSIDGKPISQDNTSVFERIGVGCFVAIIISSIIILILLIILD